MQEDLLRRAEGFRTIQEARHNKVLILMGMKEFSRAREAALEIEDPWFLPNETRWAMLNIVHAMESRVKGL